MLPVLLTDTVTTDLDRALHYTLLWGLEGVELRTIGGAEDRVPHVNEAKLKRRLAEHEMPAVAVVPGVFEGAPGARAAWLNEVVMLEETLQFCRRLGCPRVVVSPFAAGDDGAHEAAVEALQRAGRAAARYGLTLAVLNAPEMSCATGTALAALLGRVDHPAVAAAWDPAAALQAGEAPADGLAALAGRVAMVRCRDGQGAGDAWEATPVGEGAVGWAAQLRMLRQQGFDGPVSLEVHGDPRARQGLQDATTLIRLMRETRRPA